MNYIKYLESKDGTKLYTKVNEVKESKANIIIAHGLAEHLDRYDELVAFLINVVMGVLKVREYFIVMWMKSLMTWIG